MNKAELLGAVLMMAGVVAIAGYGLWLFVQAADVPAVIRLGVVALVVGMLVIILALVRERLADLQSEKKR